VDSLAEYFEHPVRKLAHFTEYAGMGVLVWWLLNGWIRKKKNLYFLVVGWVFVSAAADEFHQYFVPGRYASFWDVLLDTCGGAFGLLLCIGISAYLSNKNRTGG
jgi:VanZ family protein